MSKTDKHIGFIGAGNMAKAMINGLIQKGFSNNQLWISSPRASSLTFFKETHAIHTTQDNINLANQIDVLIFSVKPDVLKSVVLELKSVIQEKKPLLISIVAGISTTAIYQWLEDKQHTLSLVRAMPNTPALISQAVTGLFSPSLLSQSKKVILETIFSSIGRVIWLEKESWLDIVTGLSGSGPGFIFYILEAMILEASNRGLPEPIARELALTTCLGSAALALTHHQSLASLRQQVTSKNGTTFAGLQKADTLGLAPSIQQMIGAAIDRATEISQLTF